ncbi:MAG: GHMP kinase, partial [Hyphomicrobium sp.]
MSTLKALAAHVTAPARLHLGFIDLNGSLGRKYGSIGLALNAPRTKLVLSNAERYSAIGEDSVRALKILESSGAHHTPTEAYK